MCAVCGVKAEYKTTDRNRFQLRFKHYIFYTFKRVYKSDLNILFLELHASKILLLDEDINQNDFLND